MAKGRTHPGDVANLLVRCLLADASEMLGGWSEADRERTLIYFGHACAYTGEPCVPGDYVWDHLVPHNQEACGLHMYGNLVPATRAANSAKGNKDFQTFLETDRGCLGSLSAELRQKRIERLEAFQIASGYRETAEAIDGLQAMCAEQYERLKAICQENKATIQARLGGRARPVSRVVARQPRRSDGLLPITYEIEPPEAFLAHFVERKVAYIEERYADGRTEVREWRALQLTRESNLANNIRSRPQYRQGTWQAAGLVGLTLRLARPKT